MSKQTLNKQQLIDFLNKQADYFYDKNMHTTAIVYVFLRDDVMNGKFDVKESESSE